MLSHKNRFHGHGSLKYLFKHGETVRGRGLVLRYSTNPHRRQSRVSVVVSKKVHRRAVRRNRIRRRVYNIVRPMLININPTADIAIIVTSAEVDNLPHDQLTSQIVALFSDAGLYNPAK